MRPNVKLKLKIEQPDDTVLGINNVTFELSIDGKPIGGLIQKMSLEIDANDLVPKLTIAFIPAEIELDIEGGVDITKMPVSEVVRIFDLYQPGHSIFARSMPKERT